jgi:outer membrane receptor protein involved in Fe transport
MISNKLTYNCIILFLVLFVSFGCLYGQDKKRNNSSKGILKGKVVDKESSSPLESATVQIMKMRDSSMVTGAETDKKGEFNLEVPYGNYKLKISYISYSTVIISGVVINAQNTIHDAGTVMLNANMTSTEVIEVTAEENFMETTPEKKIFNVGKSLVTQGGTATDVLKNIPSVTVDADGNVSLRGSTNVKFLVDGKPSGLIGSDPTNSLQQISANSIDRIEVIDNPSAKYDPDGMSGIINLVMKKTEETGYNANISLNTGTKDKYNPSFSFNYKSKVFNLYGSYNFRLFNMDGNSVSFRQNIFGDSIFYFSQNSSQHNNMKGNMGNLGFDYNIDNKNTLSLSGTYNNRGRSENQNLFFKNLDASGNLTSQYARNNYEDHSGNGVDLTLTYDHKFNRPKENLSAALYFSNSKDNETLNINQQDYTINGGILNNPMLQNTYTNGKYNVLTFQADYYHPLGDVKKDSRFELGYKGSLRNISSDFRSETYDYAQQSFINDAFLRNNFEYKEQIHSLYGLYAGSIKDFKYQFGLRLEEALTTSDLITSNQSLDNNYFSAFPSFFISQKFLNSNELQFNYSRRINRPNLHMLNPFIDYSDPYNLRQGNPNLKPEYVNSFQLGYIKYTDFATITSSIFYKQINDMMTRLTTVSPDGVSLTTFENLNNAKSYGLEFTTNSHPFKWWDFNANFTYFRTMINGDDPNAALNNDNYSYTAKLISNFNLFDFLDFQLTYNYQGPTVLAQGRMDPSQSFDIAIKKDILNKKGSIGFRVSDLFNQLKYSSETSGPGFVQDMTRTRDSRIAFLTFSYRFGTDGNNQPKKKGKQKDDEENNENMDY